MDLVPQGYREISLAPNPEKLSGEQISPVKDLRPVDVIGSANRQPLTFPILGYRLLAIGYSRSDHTGLASNRKSAQKNDGSRFAHQVNIAPKRGRLFPKRAWGDELWRGWTVQNYSLRQNWSKLGGSWPVCLLDNWMYVKIACENFHKVFADARRYRQQWPLTAIIKVWKRIRNASLMSGTENRCALVSTNFHPRI
jgi:hypothetical protein